MKKVFAIVLLLCLAVALVACSGENYNFTEETFFLGLNNIQMYPEKYIGKNISFDCFTYRLTDTAGKEYLCGVRKCSSGYGCTCGKDTIIGFILDYDGEIPEPRNQSEDTQDKTWVHLEGTLATAEKTEVKIYGYVGDQIDYNTVETVVFCTFAVSSLSVIEDYSGLAYYVTK